MCLFKTLKKSYFDVMKIWRLHIVENIKMINNIILFIFQKLISGK